MKERICKYVVNYIIYKNVRGIKRYLVRRLRGLS